MQQISLSDNVVYDPENPNIVEVAKLIVQRDGLILHKGVEIKYNLETGEVSAHYQSVGDVHNTVPEVEQAIVKAVKQAISLLARWELYKAKKGDVALENVDAEIARCHRELGFFGRHQDRVIVALVSNQIQCMNDVYAFTQQPPRQVFGHH